MSYLRQAGGKAWARSALAEARGWFEQALGVLDTLPENSSTLEQGFEIRLELRLVLNEHWVAAVRTGNRVLDLPSPFASSAWALAQVSEASEALTRLREGEQLLERHVAPRVRDPCAAPAR